MRKRLVWIAAAAVLGAAGTASAKIAIPGMSVGTVSVYDDGTSLVQLRHYRGAIRVAGAEPDRRAATPECPAPEPSKLGLLRSNLGTSGSKIKALCRKLRA